MSWTGRSESQPCCEGPLGRVEPSEEVARLLHSRIVEPDKAAFTRTELTGHGIANPSNDCGSADGCSVDRTASLTDAEIRERSELQAQLKAGRTSEGAIIANVGTLRAITHPDAPNGQAIYIYDDARADNDRHAVLRICEHIPRSDFGEVRRAIISAFAKRVA